MTTIISSKERAFKLRKQGKSYNEINNKLGVPKSTLSSWLKTLPFSVQIKDANIKRSRTVWAENIIEYNRRRSKEYKKDTECLLKKFAKEIPLISDRNLFLIGLALFWAEGGKREKWNVRFVNSDPIMIRVIMQFFRKICNVSNKKFTLRIHLYPNIREETAKRFWLKITKLHMSQFRRSQVQISISSKGKRPINRLPYGTLHINIGDAYLNKKIKGWLLGLSKQFNK